MEMIRFIVIQKTEQEIVVKSDASSQMTLPLKSIKQFVQILIGSQY